MVQRSEKQGQRGCTRRTYLASTAVASGVLVAGCSGSGGGSDGGSDSGDGESGGDSDAGSDGDSDGTTSEDGSDGTQQLSAEVTVTHWPLLMYNPPYQIAMEKGFFEEENIRVESVAGSSGGGTTVRNVVTGGLPFGEVATPAAVNAYYAGAPITIVSAGTNTPGTINWVAPKGSEISDITDLAGKKVGYTSAGSVTQNTSGLSVKRADGVSVDEVEFQAMGGLGEGFTGLEEGAIDVAANLDPIFSNQQADDEPWQVVFWAKDYIPQFLQTAIIVGPDIIEQNPDAIEGYIRARNRGVEYLLENRDEAADIYASHNDGYDAEVTRQALENVDPESYYTTGEFNVEGLQLIEEGMKNIDLIDRDVEWSEIVDQSFLPEDKRIDVSQAEA